MLYARGGEGGETFVCMYVRTVQVSMCALWILCMERYMRRRREERERGGASLEANLQRGALHVLMN